MVSFLIRISTDHGLFATTRSFSQLVTSFFGAMYQGILLYALCSLIFFRLHVCNPSNFTFSTSLTSLDYFSESFPTLFFRINLSFLSLFLLFALMYFNLSLSRLIYLLIYHIFYYMQLSIYDLSATALWWEQVDSNHRPHAYQACALTS